MEYVLRRLSGYNSANRVNCIKCVRAITGYGLKEAKDLCDAITETSSTFVCFNTSTPIGLNDVAGFPTTERCHLQEYGMDVEPVTVTVAIIEETAKKKQLVATYLADVKKLAVLAVEQELYDDADTFLNILRKHSS